MNKHTLLPFFVLLFGFLFIFPFETGLSESTSLILFGGIFLATATYGYLILTDQAHDERELSVRGFADRLASLVGMGALVIIIGHYILISEPVPKSVVIALMLMVLAKAFGQWYACKYF